MSPYRIAPPMPEPPERRGRRSTDALDVLIWVVVATLGLAIAGGGLSHGDSFEDGTLAPH